MKVKELVDICADPKCESFIYKGQIAWQHGPDHYCTINCFLRETQKK
ncbi:hypothetical protein [Amphibacillus jilinensis]|nr:hypothetical protein [Amphibacillus jilinensis]